MRRRFGRLRDVYQVAIEVGPCECRTALVGGRPFRVFAGPIIRRCPPYDRATQFGFDLAVTDRVVWRFDAADVDIQGDAVQVRVDGVPRVLAQ